MSKHTPGPWAAERIGTSVGHVWKINPIGGCIYVDTRGGVCRKDESVAEADARLVAGAPTFLAACEAAIALIEGWDAGATEADVRRVMGQLNNAIKLAKEGTGG